jgi:choline dehydrogenase-like flavoprotein
MSYDVIVVGAGSSGGPLAARLSEDGQRSVVVLEAGPTFDSVEQLPDEVRSASSMATAFPGHPNNWSFVGNLTNDVTYSIPRGRLMGGSSSINGALFTRGTREDFDTWAERGNLEWSWSKVLPYFRRLEDDRDFDGEYHGRGGPMPVMRQQQAMMSPITDAFVEACRAMGFPDEPDKNAPGPPGVGPLPLNVIDGIRVSTAIAYLIPALHRPNLTVLGNAFVHRVLFSGQRAIGVQVEIEGELVTVRGHEIVLCAGAIKSPHIMLLSGVGPADELRTLGIPVVHDLPMVGKNLTDHPDMYIHYEPVDGIPSHPDMFMAQAALHYTAEGSSVVGGMEILPIVTNFRSQMTGGTTARTTIRSALDIVKRPLQTARSLRGVSVKKALDEVRHQGQLRFLANSQHEDSRGEVRVRSTDPHAAPALHYNYFAVATDRLRARANVRLAIEILESQSMRPFVARRTSPDTDLDLTSDTDLDQWLLAKMGTAFHTSSTCKMGPATDDTAVVDQTCRVHGLEGIRVVDTSIMPEIVRRGPNATAIMIGERAADFF